MKTEDLLTVRGLRVERSRVILEELDWSVGRDQHWAVLGPNGSGKTSLLRAIFGYLTPTSGTLEVNGERFGSTDWSAVRDRIGLLSHSLQPHIDENESLLEIILSGKASQLNYWGDPSESEVRTARRILGQMELGGRAHEPWAHLSQGERQRALLGRALHGRRRLLFLDEPCAGLDPVARSRFLQYLEGFSQTPRAPRIVLITHHVEEIIPAITHVLLLREGRVVASGPKEDALRSALLSEAFDVPLRVRRNAQAYRLQLSPEEAGGWFQ